MLNEQNRMDILSNNMANVNTVGFKKEGTTVHPFQEVLALRIKDSGTPMYADALDYIYPGVKIGENYVDFSQGPFDVTDNATELALSGDGFFAIEYTNKSGEASVKFTRDGEFHLTTDGYLVTADGDYVLNQDAALAGATGAAGYIRLDPEAEISVDEFGNVFQNDTFMAQIGVVDIDNYDYIARYGENLYELVDGGNIQASTANVVQGALEMSNVQVVSEMVELITVTRAYESNQKAIQTIDNMLDKAVNSVGKV